MQTDHHVMGSNCAGCAGCEDNLIPHGGLQEDLSDPTHVEKHNEEVRLLYVGMTRAKDQLVLHHASSRAFLGGTKRLPATISPFLCSQPTAKNPRGAHKLTTLASAEKHQNVRQHLPSQNPFRPYKTASSYHTEYHPPS